MLKFQLKLIVTVVLTIKHIVYMLYLKGLIITETKFLRTALFLRLQYT